MQKFLRVFLMMGVLAIMQACTVVNNTKYQFTDATYNNNHKKVFVDEPQGDTILVYDLSDTSKAVVHNFPPTMRVVSTKDKFNQHSFDVDFLTIPFKYRPVTEGFPRQFNTNLNGAIYLGYRTDKYSVVYKSNPLGVARRQIRHFGFSLGGFAGFGATPVNPWVTNGNVNAEYDGVVFNKGIALIMGINKMTVGFAFGFDNLLDSNDQFWIYQNKPWLGLAFGLNLN